MLIINQDRDELVLKTQPIYTVPAIYNGKLFGINLFHEGVLLGTFDSVQETLDEMYRIETCADELCFVGGFCADENDADLLQLLLKEVAEREKAN